jgi:hypothetical protein
MSFCKDDGRCDICDDYHGAGDVDGTPIDGGVTDPWNTSHDERDYWTETKDQKAENQ